MQLLCIAALLLSAVAAQPGSWGPGSQGPWQEEQLLPTGGPNADSERGDDEQSMTHAPEDGDDGSGGDLPGWDSYVSASGEEQPSGSGFMSEPAMQFGEHKGHRGQRPNRRNPVAMVFSPVFKVDNVTFQNDTDVPLKEGENVFLMPKHRGRGPHNHKGGRQGPPKSLQIVKLIYNTTEPNKVSVEFGVFKPMKLGEFIGEENNDEDY